MKVSFFAAALLGVVGLHQANAINLQSHDIDFADYEFAELDTNTFGEGLTDADGEVDVAADATADACD